ncbi:magnesium transporter [Isachenkonia alkalipeptolytica]|uniref:Magnesium transporter MgtE n=1 Tax=Isachenkonia alkalipeptolytica TaxID=2565777 RepID=A0AA44BCN7_9CLOT|nr:magnesium transporter [Isachenkonia alkalipeptolytica]
MKNESIKDLKETLKELSEIEILELLRDFASEDQVMIFRLLEKERALNIFEELDQFLQQKLIESFTDSRAEALIQEMAPDDRVKLFDEMPAKVTKRLLETLPKDKKEETALLMGFEPETAGRLMNPSYMKIKKEDTVQEALKKVQNAAEDIESIYTLYVTDDKRKLEGVISLREVMMGKEDQKIKELMNENVIKVQTDTDQEEVAGILKDLDFMAVPVVDKESRLVGVITYDDGMDILEEEMTEDIYDKAGLANLKTKESSRSAKLIDGSILQIWAVRLPFLVIALFGGLAAGAVIGAFEESLEAIAAVAIFIPVIMDMGGNAGTQSSTIFARGFILGHITPDRFLKHLGKEVLVGASMGTLVGVVAGLIANAWQPIEGLGLAVGLALGLTMTIATTLGFMIPFLLQKFGVDQAAGSDPIITTIKDISGLLIYFLLVNQFLGHLM